MPLYRSESDAVDPMVGTPWSPDVSLNGGGDSSLNGGGDSSLNGGGDSSPTVTHRKAVCSVS